VDELGEPPVSAPHPFGLWPAPAAGGFNPRVSTGEREEFVAWFESRLVPAERALHDGDAAPRSALWSRNAPVSVLGAWRSATGREEVDDLFRRLAGSFSDCTSHAHELVAVDVVGDLAYTVGYEHTQASVDGVPRTYSLRVTQVYRREDGEWKVVHRHADTVPDPDPGQSV
jgi:ketosteroid isomerase-like protein